MTNVHACLLGVCITLLAACGSPPASPPVSGGQGDTMLPPPDTAGTRNHPEPVPVQSPSWEAFCKNLRVGTAVEEFTLRWPGDDRLCEAYPHSDGPMEYHMYRDAVTGQLILVRETGAYCQGDSERDIYLCFDAKGDAVFQQSISYPFYPQWIFYAGGIPENMAGFDDTRPPGHMFYIEPASIDARERARDWMDHATDYPARMRERAAALRTVVQSDADPENRREAAQTLAALDSLLRAGFRWEGGYSVRMARRGEGCLLNALHVRVRAAPDTAAAITGSISYYDGFVEVLEPGPAQEIAPWGRHPWYRIRYTESRTYAAREGWVFGAFLVPGIFENDR